MVLPNDPKPTTSLSTSTATANGALPSYAQYEPTPSSSLCCCTPAFRKVYRFFSPKRTSPHRTQTRHRTSVQGGRVPTSISHHDGFAAYPNDGYTVEEYSVEEIEHLPASSSSNAASSARDQARIRELEERTLNLEKQLQAVAASSANVTAASGSGGTPQSTPTLSARNRGHLGPHAQQPTPQRVLPSHHQQHANANGVGQHTTSDLTLLSQLEEQRRENEEQKKEIARLQDRLELQQLKYVDEVRTLKSSSKAVSEESGHFRERLSGMDAQIEKYRVLAAAAEERANAYASRLEETDSLIRKKSDHVDFLIAQHEKMTEELETTKRGLKKMEEKNLALEQSMYQQSCSSGSTPLADEVVETQSNPAGDALTPSDKNKEKLHQYKKAHSTLGAGLNVTPLSTAGSSSISQIGATPRRGQSGLLKSLSNYHLERSGGGSATPSSTGGGGRRPNSPIDHLPPHLSVLIRRNRNNAATARFVAKCLLDCAEKAIKGERPDKEKMLALPSAYAMSDDSDAEAVAVDSSKMDDPTAEKTLRQVENSLEKLTEYLHAMHAQLMDIYQRAFHDDVTANDEACKVM